MKKMMIFVALIGLIALANAQLPILPRPDGFVYNKGSPAAPIQFESFIDLLCPDSKTSWPTLKKLATMYGPKSMRLIFHINPLIYHRQAYFAAMGVRALASSNTSIGQIFKYMDAVFKNQSQFYNQPTRNMSAVEVIYAFATLANRAIGVNRKQFNAALESSDIDHMTRLSSKLAWERGVTGTPIFFINGIRVPAGSNWSIAQWKKIIDPLLHPHLPKLSMKCGSNHYVCRKSATEYICCKEGRTCFPNYGCMDW